MRQRLDGDGHGKDVDAILAEYMRRVDAGEQVDRESLIAAHPMLAVELRAYFSQAMAMERFADGVTADVAQQATPRGALDVRCPNCHAPTAVAADTTLTDLTCSACGSHFSLVDQSKATRMAPALTKMGRFDLIERLGVGGFGSVWKARDKELDRTVAIKIPRATGMTGEEQEKFFREARAAAQLRHPSIVSVHEVGRDGDSVYIVSDFVRGVTLGDWLTGQQLTSREAAELCAKIADALQHAHEQGVVHRDLKPANIMIDGDGQPHLMDFGLARREVGEVTVTMDGQVLGTPAYMSPEQAEGKGHEADRRSDVYSLGVILFQLLTGELPFRGNARMLIHQVINDQPPSPRKFNGNIKKDLETISLKCLEKEPVRRYQTAKDVADDLRRFLAGEPIQARPAGRIERTWRWARRRPAAAALLTVLGAVAVVAPLVAGGQAALRRQAEDAELGARNAELTAREAEKKAIAEAQRAEREAGTSKRLADVAGAKYALTQGRVHDAFQQIASAIKSQPALEYGRILDDIVDAARRDWQLLQRIPCEQVPNWGCFVGPGPKWFVISQGDTIEVRSLVREKPLTTIHLKGGGYSPCAVGADVIAIATSAEKIAIYELPNLKHVADCDFPGKTVEIRSDAEGRYFAALNQDGLVRVFERNGNQKAERRFPTAGVDFPTFPSVDISPSGQSVSYDPGWYAKSKSLWKWQTGELSEFPVEANQLRLDSDEVGYGHLITIDNLQIFPIFAKDSEAFRFGGRGFLYSDGAKLEGFGLGKSVPGLALLCDKAIHHIRTATTVRRGVPVTFDEILRNNRSNDAMNLTRYDSLWPHGDTAPRLFAYESFAHTLALATSHEVIVLVRWLPRRQVASAISTDIATTWRNLSMVGDFVLTSSASAIQVTHVRTRERFQYVLKPPASEDATSMHIRRITVTPDSHWLAVLWQETGRSENEVTYLRKFVQVYETPKLAKDSKPRKVNEFELKEFFGGRYYLSGKLMLSPNGRVIGWCDHDGKIEAYRAQNGEKIYTLEAPSTPTYAICADPPLLGVGNYVQPTNYRVWNFETGEQIASLPLDAANGRAAFSPSGKSLYIGLASNVVRQYRLRDSTLLSETKTPAAPVAISPVDDRYVGFVTDASRVGSLVLADLPSGRILEVIHASAFALNDAGFASDGQSIVFVSDSNRCQVIKSPNVAEAVRRLEQSAIDSGLAAKSNDLLDYREKMAGGSVGPIAIIEQWSAGEQGLRDSTNAWESLAADFPRIPRYQEIVATKYEELADRLARSDIVESRRYYAYAIDSWERLIKSFPNEDRYQSALAEVKMRAEPLQRRRNTNLAIIEATMKLVTRFASKLRQPSWPKLFNKIRNSSFIVGR